MTTTNQELVGAQQCGGLLGVAFVVLKLCHVIDWSWWWVLAPFWGPLALALAIGAAAFLFIFLRGWFE